MEKAGPRDESAVICSGGVLKRTWVVPAFAGFDPFDAGNVFHNLDGLRPFTALESEADDGSIGTTKTVGEFEDDMVRRIG